MTLFARLFRLVWGGDVDRALRPVLAVGLTGSIAGSALFPFLGIWAIKELHAAQSAVAVTYLVGTAVDRLTRMRMTDEEQARGTDAAFADG